MNLRSSALFRASAMALMLLLVCPRIGLAQALTYSEDFTGAASNNQWFFYNGACLTAGTGTLTTSPGYIPGCQTIFTNYYYPILSALGKSSSDSYLSGGDLGCLGVAPPCPSTTITPDLLPAAGNGNSGGALRFTNGAPYGYHENGAIVSNFTFPSAAGLQITFKTVTYHGDNNGGHGADGISFYLLDACMPIAGGTLPSGCPASKVYGASTFPAIGAWGGSLAYTCSNANLPYNGLAGAYLGLGIDEWGNFLNGTFNTLSEGGTSATGDNTASGGGYQPGRIGLRGAGNISWVTLNNAYGTYTTSSSPYYPTSLTTSCYIQGGTYSSTTGLCSGGNTATDAMMAVQKTCANGTLYNFGSSNGSSSTVNSTSANNPTKEGPTSLTNGVNTAGILDYTAMATAYKVITGFSIANESATIRGSTLVANSSSNDANPITYQLKITQDGLLSLSFAYNGGTWQPVITSQNITSANGALPANFRFGFAGSTGGSTNIHEVMCFKVAPSETSQSSGGVNVYENPTIKYGTQLFLAYYLPSDWTGQLTAQTIFFNGSTVQIKAQINWDASCVLTGVSDPKKPCSTGATSMSPEAPTSRTMLTWNGTTGIPVEWSNLTPAQQSALDQGDTTTTSNRLSFLRGDRTNEISSTGTCPQQGSGLACFRIRDSVLGDIVDSSPTWVGPPQTYATSGPTAVTWTDKLYPNRTAPEVSGQLYKDFQAQQQGRLNVVYIGSNDGFLHGFRAGSLDASGNLVDNSTTPNDGYEVLAYMPGAVLQTIHNTSVELDYANTQYSHNWFVDATPATGDVFYAGVWHTWLVGGLGPGGAAIYALDVTNPANFSEGKAANTVIGEWTPSTITCVNVSNCGQNLGNTYGTPQIRRFHNGSWGVIFGNGYGSQANSSAGIFIMLIDPNSGNRSVYYLGTPALKGNPANGVASPSSLDMELDHIIDYIYAADLQGNIWRFDVTSTNPANWGVSASSPLFSVPGNLPITTALTVGALHPIILTSLGGEQIDWGTPERVIVNFGTGRMIPQTLTQNAQFATGTQYLYGIWDWDMTAWNALSQYKAVAMSAPQTVSSSVLQSETVVTASSGSTTYRYINNPHPVCWTVVKPLDASSLCPVPGTQFGWQMALPATNEQVIFNPVLSPDGELVVNTFIPSADSPLSCNAGSASSGFTMAVQPDTGNGLSNDAAANQTGGYFMVNTNGGFLPVDGIQLNGTGIPWFLSSGQKADKNTEYLITQTPNGAATPTPITRHTIISGKRVSWTQRR
jgi:type IV pilus assembly protein PilY1